MTHDNQNRYFGDDRDLLEAIYPTCASFVRIATPQSSERSVEVAFDPTKEEEKKFFSIVCYAYEDSYDWNMIPLVYRRADQSEIIWRSSGRIVRKTSLAAGIAHFDEFTKEIIPPNQRATDNDGAAPHRVGPQSLGEKA